MGRKALAAWLLAVACAMAWATAAAQATATVPENVKVPAWKELSSQQQADLADFARRWDRLPASRRVLILERHARWKQLPARKRELIHEGERNFRQLSPGQREKTRLSLAAMRALPMPEQRRLRQTWRSLSPQQRRDWLDRGGPGIAPPP